jgi:hypothetical protein
MGSGTTDGGKSVTIVIGSSVQLEIWAQVTNTAPVNNIFGVQTILGAIVSSNDVGIIGFVDPMAFPIPFNVSAVPGAQNELSTPADTIGDLGTPASPPLPTIQRRARIRRWAVKQWCHDPQCMRRTINPLGRWRLERTGLNLSGVVGQIRARGRTSAGCLQRQFRHRRTNRRVRFLTQTPTLTAPDHECADHSRR